MSQNRAIVSLSLLLAAFSQPALALDLPTQPGLEPGSKLPYLFSVPGNVVFGLVFLLLAFAHIYLFTKGKQRWTLVLPIAEIFSAIGYFLRILMRSKQHSVMLYSVSTLFVVLSPAAFLAFNYMMFGRLIVSLDGNLTSTSKRTTPSRYSLVPPRIFGVLFVWSDVITFIIQAGGGAMQAAGGSTGSTGNTLFLIGVVAQAISYIIFIFLFVVSNIRLREQGMSGAVKMLFGGLYFASVCILIRSFFRIAEMAEGYHGMLFHSENFLFALDSLPLVLCNLVWIFIWPPTLMEKDAISRQEMEKGLDMGKR